MLAAIEIEMLRSVSEVMVSRTIAIDDAIDEVANPQLGDPRRGSRRTRMAHAVAA